MKKSQTIKASRFCGPIVLLSVIWLNFLVQLFQSSFPSGGILFPTRRKPTKAWLATCTANMQTNITGSLVPFNSLRVGYALGDCVKMCHRCTINKKTLAEEAINGRMAKPQALAKQYYDTACPLGNPNYSSGGNYTVMEKLLNKLDQSTPGGLQKPDPESIVIHLRLGDVVERAQISPLTMLESGGHPAHIANFNSAIKSVYEYIENIEAAKVSKVYIVGGGYGLDGEFEKSRIYASCLEQALQYAGYEVVMELDSGDADKDFYFMVHAPNFVSTTGGFSTLIGNMVKHFGGVVQGRTFDDMSNIKLYEIMYTNIKENEFSHCQQ